MKISIEILKKMNETVHEFENEKNNFNQIMASLSKFRSDFERDLYNNQVFTGGKNKFTRFFIFEIITASLLVETSEYCRSSRGNCC